MTQRITTNQAANRRASKDAHRLTRATKRVQRFVDRSIQSKQASCAAVPSTQRPPHSDADTSTSDSYKHVSLLFFAIAAITYVSILFTLSKTLLQLDAFATAVVSLSISIPIIAVYSYTAAVQRIAMLEGALKRQSFVFQVLSGFFFRILASFVLAIWTSMYILASIIYSPAPDWWFWISFVISIPLIYGFHHCLYQPLFRNHVKPFARQAFSLVSASMSAAFVVTLFFAIATEWSSQKLVYLSLSDAIDAQPAHVGASRLMALFFDIFRIIDGVSDYGLGLLRHSSDLPSVIYVAVYIGSTYLFFLGITSALSVFLVNPRGLVRRVFGSPSSSPFPSPISPRRTTLATFILLILCGSYFHLFSDIRVSCERIGNHVVHAGTFAITESLRERTTAQLGQINADSYNKIIEPEIRSAFKDLRANVPEFLDWYYSIPSEFSRLGVIVSGAKLGEKLSETLAGEAAFAGIDNRLDVLNQVNRSVVDEFRIARTRIIRERECQVSSATPLDISRTIDLSYLQGTFATDQIRFQQRLWGSAAGGLGGGVVGSVVGYKLLSKVAAKGTLRTAVKALLRFVVRPALSRAASAATVAAAGSRVGRTLGPVGALAGAVVGAVVGAVATDLALLKLEEVLGRQQLQDEIMEAIELTEEEVLTETKRMLVGS